jgi:uncharacterized protein (TIGR02145 family)
VDLPDFHTIPNGFPGIASQADVTEPVKTAFKGALVYNTGVTSPPAGIYVWNGTNWTPPTDNCLPAENLTLSLTASSNAPAVNTPDTFTVSSNVSARCAGSETYTWSLPGADANDYDILSISGNRASIQFITAGAYTVRVEVRNPYSTGTAIAEMIVLAGGIVTAPDYYLAGKPCYDINKTATYDSRHVAISAAARVATSTDFSVSANRTRTYKFCHDDYTNLFVFLLEDNGGLVESISQPDGSDQTGTPGCKTFTVTFKDNVESLVTGAGYSVKLLASYRDKTNQPKMADMEISVQDGLCACPAKINSSTWSTFQCHNLGADYDITSDADLANITATNFREYHGDWYRYGAKNVSLVNDGTYEGNQTQSEVPNWSSYPIQDDTQNWITSNDPCPAGWRLPTNGEWAAVISGYNAIKKYTGTSGASSQTWDEDNTATPSCCYNNAMKVGDYLYLPAAGYRFLSNGFLSLRGKHGYYWSSTTNGSTDGYNAYDLRFYGDVQTTIATYRRYGLSVRCVAAE